MKRCVGVNTCERTGVFALDWSLWVVRDLSCYLVHHLVILSRPDPPRPTELLFMRCPCIYQMSEDTSGVMIAAKSSRKGPQKALAAVQSARSRRQVCINPISPACTPEPLFMRLADQPSFSDAQAARESGQARASWTLTVRSLRDVLGASGVGTLDALSIGAALASLGHPHTGVRSSV